MKVFVSGVFDMLHSGHVEFLRIAASRGDLLVSVGSDDTVQALKGRPAVCSQDERLFMVRSIRYVAHAFIARGSGELDFRGELSELRPSVFIVNEDGHSERKRMLCRSLGIEYSVLPRLAQDGLPVRTTTSLRENVRIPFRVDLAGGWLDQPSVSRHAHGPVVTVSLEPSFDFAPRSGMASSTRAAAIRLWGRDLPIGAPTELARVLFAYENMPGREYTSGSQDALGIAMPAINALYYDGDYWPSRIESCTEEETLQWIERHVRLLPLQPRPAELDVTAEADVNAADAQKLASAAHQCWQAIRELDLTLLARSLTDTAQVQTKMFPHMAGGDVGSYLRRAQASFAGAKLAGAGGGGYLIVADPNPPREGLQLNIRRPTRACGS